MGATGKVKIDRELCKACELCLEHCPKSSLRLSSSLNERGYYPAEFAGEDCTGCALCAVICPEAGIEVWRG
jgi:2-oxoglutarate ferredoxin oxidoreductase subunit delta